jgi:hypothetical protein
MPSNKKLLQAAAGNAGESLYVEDVFSTYLYTGNGTGQTITNDIDLSGEGGLVWMKDRTTGNASVGWNTLVDTERGGANQIWSNSTSGQVNLPSRALTFNSNGFSVSADTYHTNRSGDDFASWTFRKAEKFFDVVTYTGDGNAATQISHSLGSTPGFIVCKRTSTSGGWASYHASLGTGKYLSLNGTHDAVTDSAFFPEVTDGFFRPGSDNDVNGSGYTYVAYLFASDAGGFGDDESIIKCGSYTGNGTYLDGPEIDLGFEPQWLLIKSTGTESWRIADNMRGIEMGTAGAYLSANLTQSEVTSFGVELQATGFKVMSNNADLNSSGQDYIYIAIRRPMKTPESGTEVFSSLAYTGDGASTRDFDLGMAVDAYFQACRSSSSYDFKNLTARLTGKGLYTAGNGAEFITNTSLDVQDGLRAIGFENTLNQSGQTYIINGFKRATGFFDVVAYTGDGINARQIIHNLKAEPELIISKKRSATSDWIVYAKNNGIAQNAQAILNGNNSFGWYAGLYPSPYATDSVYYIASNAAINQSGQTYISYLFATLAGVSKVFSVTKSSGSNADVDCGFSAGARFILLKRTDSTGDWYVYDSERGIVAGNDPYLLLNSTAAEVTSTDYIDPLSSGFTIVDGGLANGDYIGLAIA